ncbi:uncharacterized small protein (DUF1192 family) [Azospirillum lipoferum]|uniref:DUF1192 domain-containing protein n=1 Tax=Azospirillum lipoferum TaxID=193 RepID=A0A5A9GVY0_AZOLI|nr:MULTISPECIES: DUF1192 family protein [Azospirillum]KAA0598596.1 DUF1192 domain-containing protein [Azospirillum lipoferum]MCP1609390.1 uncharacterized small protein (DUF1192 family) [Azospirillum lipoferum]MDW5535301.1 DUF1192 family protein [Azospirillum sp. NL1]
MAIDDRFEDLEPRKAKPAPKDLTVMGVAEIEAYIATLEAEITRARAAIAAIAAKQAQKSAAEAFFKKG